MKNLQDLFNDVANSVKNKFSNPLVNAFLFSWMTWNYKFLLVVFLDGGLWPEKIYYIENFIFNGYKGVILGFILPLITALLWIYVLPPLFTRVSVWHVRQNNVNDYLVNKASREKILTQSDNLNLRRSINKQWKELENLTNENSFAIERHAKQINDLVKEREKLLQDLTELSAIVSKKDNIISNKNNRIETAEKRIDRMNVVINEKREPFICETFINKSDEEISNLIKSIFSFKNNVLQYNFVHYIRNKYNSRLIFPLCVKKRIIYKQNMLLDKGNVITVDFILALYFLFEVYGEEEIFNIGFNKFSDLMRSIGFNENVIISYFTYHGLSAVNVIDNKVVDFRITDSAYLFYCFFEEIGFYKQNSISLNREITH